MKDKDKNVETLRNTARVQTDKTRSQISVVSLSASVQLSDQQCQRSVVM